MLDFSRFGINVMDHYDNIIGVDFGHGEVSAALWKLNGENVSNRPLDLSFDSNDKHKIYTALFITNEGTYKIGEEALRNRPGTGRLYTCFKTRPSRLERNEWFPNEAISKKKLVQIFFREVIRTLYKFNEVDMRGENIFLVGCPSGGDWLENDNDIIYANILYEGLDKNVPIVIMPESRAALIKVIKERGHISSEKGVVVFDFGSSTSDSTYIYISGKTAVDIDASEPLGASFIEQKMLEDFCEAKGKGVILKDVENSRLDLRKVKEAHFLSPEGEINAIVSFQDGPEVKVVDDEYMKFIVYHNRLMYFNSEKQNVKGSWVELCEQFLNKVKLMLQGRPIGTVLLTGGASRMPFIQDLCGKVFQDATLIVDNDPSYCVSRGLAWAGKTDFEAQIAFSRTIKDIRQFLSQVDYSDSHLINNIIKEIAGNIYLDIHEKVVKQELLKWKSTSVNETPNDLCRHMNDTFRKVLQEEVIQNKIKKVVAEQLRKSQNDILCIIDNNYKSIYGCNVPMGYQFEITNEMLDRVKGKLSNIKITLNSSSTVNEALGYFGWGNVVMDATCMPDDRKAKADRALYVESRVQKLKELCKTEIRYDMRCGKSIDYVLLVEEIMKEFTPQIEKMVERLALYFAK